MRKSGLTDGALSRLQDLVTEKKAGRSLATLLHEDLRPVALPHNTQKTVAPIVSVNQHQAVWRDPESDQDIIMKVLQEGSGSIEEEGGDLMKDTLRDMQKSKGVNTGTSPKKPKGLGKGLFNKDWGLKASRRYLSLLKKSYDVRNFYLQDSERAENGSLSISVALSLPQGSEKNANDLKGYVSDVISQALNLGGEHHLLVTANNGLGGPPVSVDLEGVEPSKESELRTLVEGLAVEAVTAFADHKE